jgi:RimJ/RimL family protein N-acetyltransferase
MWVEEAARGRGIARQILDALIAEADRAGVEMLRLETGVASHVALALYEKTGFKRSEPFADYRPDPLSVFMERSLWRGSGSASASTEREAIKKPAASGAEPKARRGSSAAR